MTWLWAPPSDQAEKVNRLPGAVWGEATARLWLLPGVHSKTWGAA